jgi:ATP phosphoribosyltransferase regulatory subunit
MLKRAVSGDRDAFMNEYLSHPALLPAGFRDVLPPEAEMEARTVETIMECFAAHGYDRVKPPLLEFEDSLLTGSGAAVAEQTFRLMDPDSQRMMGLRADTTPQIARLAATRLAAAPRPLRLAYAGQCLRVRGSHLSPERQIAQAGIELIGVDLNEADAEIIATAVTALAAIGLTEVSVDLTAPLLIPRLLETLGAPADPELLRALDRKDRAMVAVHGGRLGPTIGQLLGATGPAAQALPALLALDLPPAAHEQAQRMAQTVRGLARFSPGLKVTIDPVESRGYQYHTGLATAIYAIGSRTELGRGGRYQSLDNEPATGMTLYPDAIIQAIAPAARRPRVFLPFGTSLAQAQSCRAQHFATIPALVAADDPQAEAARLGCTHVFANGAIIRLTERQS